MTLVPVFTQTDGLRLQERLTVLCLKGYVHQLLGYKSYEVIFLKESFPQTLEQSCTVKLLTQSRLFLQKSFCQSQQQYQVWLKEKSGCSMGMRPFGQLCAFSKVLCERFLRTWHFPLAHIQNLVFFNRHRGSPEGFQNPPHLHFCMTKYNKKIHSLLSVTFC